MLNRYITEIKRNLNYFATWMPSEQLKLGDYGILRGYLFERIGNVVDDFGVEIIEDRGTSYTDYSFRDGVSVEGSLDIGKEIKISFGSRQGIYFQASGCKKNQVRNYEDIGREIIKYVEEERFQSQYVVITEIIKATSATIILAKDNEAEIVVQAPISEIATECVVKGEKNIGFSALGKQNLTPLFGVSKVGSKIISGSSWNRHHASSARPSVKRDIKKLFNKYQVKKQGTRYWEKSSHLGGNRMMYSGEHVVVTKGNTTVIGKPYSRTSTQGRYTRGKARRVEVEKIMTFEKLS